MSSSCRTSNAGAGIGGKRSSVAWGKGEESESGLSGNGGMAAAVLSPGGIFVNKNKKGYQILTTSTFPSPTPIRVY